MSEIHSQSLCKCAYVTYRGQNQGQMLKNVENALAITLGVCLRDISRSNIGNRPPITRICLRDGQGQTKKTQKPTEYTTEMLLTE